MKSFEISTKHDQLYCTTPFGAPFVAYGCWLFGAAPCLRRFPLVPRSYVCFSVLHLSVRGAVRRIWLLVVWCGSVPPPLPARASLLRVFLGVAPLRSGRRSLDMVSRLSPQLRASAASRSSLAPTCVSRCCTAPFGATFVAYGCWLVGAAPCLRRFPLVPRSYVCFSVLHLSVRGDVRRAWFTSVQPGCPQAYPLLWINDTGVICDAGSDVSGRTRLGDDERTETT